MSLESFTAPAYRNGQHPMVNMHSPIWQGVGDAALSFLPMSIFLLLMKVMFWAIATYDPYDHYDSRIGMIFPAILPLFLLGLVLGVRACWTVIRGYQRARSLFTPPIILGIIGLLVPFFLGIFFAVRFLLLLIWPLSSLQPPQHLQYGLQWYQKGNYDRAIKEYTAAIKTHPHSPDAFYGRGLSWYQKGNYDQAIKDYTEVIKIDPHYRDAFFYRGFSWDQKGDYDQAIKDYTAAIAIHPRAYAYNNLSWLLATCPIAQYRNGTKAIELAKRAIELSPQIMYYWDTLAAAYAETGDFNNAITTQENVIYSLKKDGLKKEGTQEKGTEEELSAYLIEVTKRLDAYKKHEPWREVRILTREKRR